MSGDNLNNVFNKFMDQRAAPLVGRFPPRLRAVVVDTNDPLRMGRIRFKCPEMHDFDVKDEDCQWALPAPEMGGKGCGAWHPPMIDDWIWIEFEKGHPYAPLWTGFADPTRRKYYPLDSISGPTPLPVKEKFNPEKEKGDFNVDQAPEDYQEQYLPKDNRPMSNGYKDRYGNMFIMSAVGFFPIEHDEKATPVGQDPVSDGEFKGSKAKPVKNDPDMKFMATVTKYGIVVTSSDIGYDWKEEFDGDFDEDNKFEIARANYLREQLSEKEAKERDQRRYEVRTRYGHKMEFRDVGWNKTRKDEYDAESKEISKGEKDERWMKFRTKDGHIIQLWDKGSDPEDDSYIARLLKDEIGDEVDDEDGAGWTLDGRQVRIVTRYGFKLVLDDRGSAAIDAEKNEAPRGNGVLIKGRRANRGYGFEFNEKDQLNHMLMYSPKSKILELNDKEDFVILCTDTNQPISEPWVKLKDNEFALNNAMVFDPEKDTFHLKLDKKNDYARFVTPKQQGLEMRDGGLGKTWVEVRDTEDRGLWFTKDKHLSVFRSNDSMFVVMNDQEDFLIIHNNEPNGVVQIYSEKDIELIAKKDLKLKANNIHMSADQRIVMQGGGRNFVVGPGQVGSAGPIDASRFNGFFPNTMPGGGANSGSPVAGSPDKASKISIKRTDLSPLPFDQERGQTTNKPQKPVGIEVIRS
jgi:hypothetical protein